MGEMETMETRQKRNPLKTVHYGKHGKREEGINGAQGRNRTTDTRIFNTRTTFKNSDLSGFV